MGWMLLIGLVLLVTGWTMLDKDRRWSGLHGLMAFVGFWLTVGAVLYG